MGAPVSDAVDEDTKMVKHGPAHLSKKSHLDKVDRPMTHGSGAVGDEAHNDNNEAHNEEWRDSSSKRTRMRPSSIDVADHFPSTKDEMWLDRLKQQAVQALGRLWRVRKRIPRGSIALFFWALLIAVAVGTYALMRWVLRNWGNLTMDEILFTLTGNLEGTNPTLVGSGIRAVVPPALLAGFGSACGLILAERYLSDRVRIVRSHVYGTGALLAALLVVGSAVHFTNEIKLGEYINNQAHASSFIDENYVEPLDVHLSFPEHKRNLIYLFLESMEISFSDESHGGAKRVDVIPELTEIALKNGSFSGEKDVMNGAYALYGGTYTMGGLFTQTAGVPLSISPETLAEAENFLPGVVTLGDILSDAGYKNYFCIGTNAAFGERDRYFRDHGNFEMLDYAYAIAAGEIPSDYSRDFWGYDDYLLFENAKKHLTEIASAQEPFNFTMLTVDTHAEDGYLCDQCDNTFGDDRYANVLACSSKQVARFVEWIQKQDFYEDTTIVIAGDHCTKDSDFMNDAPDDYERRVFTVFINPDVVGNAFAKRDYTTLDCFPTTLAALGVSIEGERLGLGTNLFSDAETLTEHYGKEQLDSSLAQKSDFLENKLGERQQRDHTLSFDEQNAALKLSVDADISVNGEFLGLNCEVLSAATQISHRYDLALDEDGSEYVAIIPLSDFDYVPTIFDISVYVVLSDRLYKLYLSDSIDLSNIVVSDHLEATVSDDGSALEIWYRPNARYDSVAFPVWSGENGEDDMERYSATLLEDGRWFARVDLEAHESTEQLNILVEGSKNVAATVIDL